MNPKTGAKGHVGRTDRTDTALCVGGQLKTCGWGCELTVTMAPPK